MARSNKVTVYVRVPGTRERERATNKNTVATGTVYCLRYVRAGKRCWETLDVTSFAEAQKVAIDRNVALIVGKPVPIPEPRPEPIKPKPTVQTGAVLLAEAIDQYHEKVKARSGRTVSAYTFTLSQFYKCVQRKKRFVQDIAQDDLLDFVKFLRETKVGNRTIYNRLVEIGTFLRASGIKDVKEMLKGVQVTYVAKVVRAYRQDELAAMFAVANAEEWILFQFFFCSGAREQEVQFATWNQVDFVDKIFTIEGAGQKTKKTKKFPCRIF
jgi:hypothetical protein